MTLDQIAYDIAATLNQTDNMEFVRRVKFNVHIFRALMIRQELQRHKNPNAFMQTIGCLELESVDAGECCSVCTNVRFMKSIQELPKYVNLSGSDPLFSVSNIKYGSPYSFIEPHLLFNRLEHSRFSISIPYYFIENNHLYTTHTTKKIKVRGIFEDPTELANFRCSADNSGALCYADNQPYPVSADIVARMGMAILQGKFNLRKPEEEGSESHLNITEAT